MLRNWILALAVATFTGPAFADTTRGCRAIWEVRYGAGVRTFGLFESRGSCRGDAWANDCRRRARSYAQNCFWDHWANRNVAAVTSGARIPGHCIGRGNIGVRNYTVTDVKEEVERSACSMRRSPGYEVIVIGKTFDGTRCDGEVLLSGTYTIRQGMC